MSIQLFQKQLNAVYFLRDKDTRSILYGGSAGSGKSMLGCLWLIEMCQKYPRSRWVMGRSRLKTLKETTLRTFMDMSRQLDLMDQYTYLQQAAIIKWTNGSEIILKDLEYKPSDEDYDSLGSLEICGGFVDEAAQITFKCFSILSSRCRYKLKEFGITPKLLMSCNPDKGWLYQEFYKPWRDGTLREDRAFVQALPTDNPHLPPSYIEALKMLPEASKQRLYHGNWEFSDDDDLLFEYEDIVAAFENEYVPKGKRCMTADIAAQGSDLFVIMVWDGMRVEKIYTMRKSDGKQIIELIKTVARRHKISSKNIVYDADGIGGFVSGFVKSGFQFRNGGKPVGKKLNYANLKTQCYFELAKRFKDGQIYIADKKKLDHIAEELDAIRGRPSDIDAKMKVSNKKEVRNLIGRSPDFADALMMRMAFELIKMKSGVRARN